MPPSSPEIALADARAVHGTLRTGSTSFHAAALLLPASLRHPATSVYAFCREADDAIDAPGAHAGALATLGARLDGVYAGLPGPVPTDRALASVVARHGIPRALFDALLEGFAWDAQDRRYEDLAGVLAYSARVAGTVGAILAVLMGRRRPEVLARACDLGVAMQLTNIARDVGEDARRGRLYLPRAWMREAGLDPDAFLASPTFDPRLAAVIERLLVVADGLYARADGGIAALPRSCRPAIRAARLIYAEIGAEIRRAGHDSVSRRAVVSGSRKLALALRALPALLWRSRPLSDPPLPETRFLVEAAA